MPCRLIAMASTGNKVSLHIFFLNLCSGKGFKLADGSGFGIGGAGMGDLCKLKQGNVHSEMFIMGRGVVSLLYQQPTT